MYAAGGPWSVKMGIQARSTLFDTMCAQRSTTQVVAHTLSPFGHNITSISISRGCPLCGSQPHKYLFNLTERLEPNLTGAADLFERFWHKNQ